MNEAVWVTINVKVCVCKELDRKAVVVAAAAAATTRMNISESD